MRLLFDNRLRIPVLLSTNLCGHFLRLFLAPEKTYFNKIHSFSLQKKNHDYSVNLTQENIIIIKEYQPEYQCKLDFHHKLLQFEILER